MVFARVAVSQPQQVAYELRLKQFFRLSQASPRGPPALISTNAHLRAALLCMRHIRFPEFFDVIRVRDGTSPAALLPAMLLPIPQSHAQSASIRCRRWSLKRPGSAKARRSGRKSGAPALRCASVKPPCGAEAPAGQVATTEHPAGAAAVAACRRSSRRTSCRRTSESITAAEIQQKVNVVDTEDAGEVSTRALFVRKRNNGDTQPVPSDTHLGPWRQRLGALSMPTISC